ncbi:Ubiquitin carboxyl-terminal hydrolase 5 [Orchesella cincta]|uniref:Ubiquitin carboxyl-terminal hydrolase n=1 Tax=Orchesella cincta TaxID=48709 RepID=A0A1D2NL93_ORCCI|nr:Ubiquitin carboxyl-terminal hydrolase 5 [Orchesella cincta]
MMDVEAIKILQDGFHRVRTPGAADRVWKDECVYSFDTPESGEGLFVCLRLFWGLGRDHVEQYQKRTGNSIFLHIRRTKTKVETPHINNGDGPEKKVTRLAIGVEGGFDATKPDIQYDFKEEYGVILLPGFIRLALPNDQLPKQILDSIAGVLAAESATKLAEAEALAGTWDGEVRLISKHCDNLQQLDNGKKVPPKGWRCEAEGCLKTENLWMNLTDGMILCGRKYADGSGGNNHAVEHYDRTKYPLAVKLGTITPDGKADVYSYAEDDMVLDSNLVQHLAHFGINVAQMEKTERTMIEMEIDLNQRNYSEISALTEAGRKLKPLCGPGLTGLTNLGNSCYLNSIVQVLFTVPNFQDRFIKNGSIYIDASQDPVGDFNVQMSKLAHGLLSGKYAVKAEDSEDSDRQVGISPHMFKHLVGRGHTEFSTKKQQDAQEYFLHLVNVLERHSRGDVNPADCFKFIVEDKVQCDASRQVKYTQRTEYFLPLPIPMDSAINKEEFEAYEKRKEEAKAQKTTLAQDDIVRPIIPFEACLQTFVEKETLDPFYSTAVQRLVTASKFTRLASFPDYLVIQLKKFTMGQDWTPQKLDVSVDMPLEIDLSVLKAKGLQQGEVELPDEPSTPSSKPKVTVDETVVSQLMEMGFHPNACRRAVMLSGNAGAEIAMNWIMQHMEDPDLNDPINCDDAGPQSGSFLANPDALASIVSMGFTPAQALKALQATDNNLERAVDWIFSHAEQLDAMVDNANLSAGSNSQSQGANNKPTGITDGSPKYKLMAFVSHMGSSSMVGHYVCHVLKDGAWALFNDSRVAASETLPKDLGYLYFYKRV